MSLIRPLVISGPSGCGKGTLIKFALSTYPDCVGLSSSFTTRAPRKGEVHGKDYFFVSKEEFEEVTFSLQKTKAPPISWVSLSSRKHWSDFSQGKAIKENKLLEYVNYNGNFYGTHVDQVTQIAKENKVSLELFVLISFIHCSLFGSRSAFWTLKSLEPRKSTREKTLAPISFSSGLLPSRTWSFVSWKEEQKTRRQ